MPTTPPSITALPTPPSRSDSVNFAARADAFVGALPTFGTEANSLATNVYANALEAEADAVAAAASETAAAAFAASAQASANVTLWVSGTSYTIGQNVYSPLTFFTYRRKTNGAGTTDPSLDSTNWQVISGTVSSVAISGGTTGLTVTGSPITTSGTITFAGTLAVANGGTGLTSPGASGNVLTSNGTEWVSGAPGGLPQLQIVSGTTQSAESGKHYILTNAAATTVTLPAAPAAGDAVWVTVANGRVDNVIARVGGSPTQNIQSIDEDLTLNATYAFVQLRYVDSIRGWVFS